LSTYAIRRTVYALVMMFLASTIIFFVLHATPGNPYGRMLNEMQLMGKKLPPESHMARLYELMGLNRPISERYVAWLQAVARGDFGATWSVGSGQSVGRLVLSRVPYTLLLMLAATILAVIIAFPLGLYSALHPYTDGDMAVTSLSFFGMAMPSFWFGLMAISILGLGLGWMPIGGVVSRSLADRGDIISALGRLLSLGWANKQSAGFELQLIADGIWHLILPAFTLSLFSIARWSRFLRAAILEVLGNDFIRTARAYGVPERRILRRHVLRNALVPLITIMTLDIPALFTGAVITEIVFAWPGIGRLYIDGIRGADWPLVQGLLVINTALIVFANLVADLAYGVADPRIRYT
jgi:peptide/nickel transport system permease protein